jgi:hypothetical protein
VLPLKFKLLSRLYTSLTRPAIAVHHLSITISVPITSLLQALGRGRVWMRSAYQRQKEGANRSESNGSRQIGHEASRAGRPPWYAAGRVLVGRQRARQPVFRAALLTAGVTVQDPCGRPRKRPKKVHADQAYDYRKGRQALHRRASKGRIARHGKDRKARLGHHR